MINIPIFFIIKTIYNIDKTYDKKHFRTIKLNLLKGLDMIYERDYRDWTYLKVIYGIKKKLDYKFIREFNIIIL